MADSDTKDLKSGMGDHYDSSKPLTTEEVIHQIEKWDSDSAIKLSGHSGAVWAITATSDNKIVFSGSEDKQIIIWDVTTQQSIGELLGHEATINVLEITKDNKYLVSGDWNSSIKIWDWQQKIKVGELVGSSKGVYCSRLLKDGDTLITGGGDFNARMWSISQRSLLFSFDCANTIFGLAVTSDEKTLIAGTFDGNIKVFDLTSKTLTSTHEGKSGAIQAMAITPNTKFLIFGTRTNLIKVWNWADKTLYMSLEVHNNWVRNLTTTKDSLYFISASADKTIRIFNLTEKQEEHNFDKNDGYMFGLFLSVDGTILYSGGADKLVTIRNVGTIDKVNVLKGHEKCIMSISISSDDKYAVSSSEDKTIRVWDLKTYTEIACIRGHTETIWGVTITPDMKYIVSVSGDKKVCFWNFSSYECVKSLEFHANPIFCVTASPNSKYVASGGQDKKAMIWDVENLCLKGELVAHTDTIFSVKFSYNSQILFSGAADYTIRTWDVRTCKLLLKFDTKSGMIESIAITRDNRCLVLGDRGNSVHLFNWEEQTLIKKFKEHTLWVKSVGLSTDEKYAVSASNDKSIRIWNIAEKRRELILNGHTSTIRSVSFSSDGSFLVSGSEDLTVRVWNLKERSVLKMSNFGNSFETFLFLNTINQKKEPKKRFFCETISPLRINLVHIYSYLGQHELLKKALLIGTPIQVDVNGRSPLFYSLERNSQNCIDVTLSYLNELLHNDMETFLNYCWSLRSDFVNLLKNRSVYLPEFLNHVFYTSTQLSLPKFGIPLGPLPMHRYDTEIKITARNFLVFATNKEDVLKEIIVEFRLLPFPIDMISGSSGSLKMLNNILDCPNHLIFRSDLIQVIINAKWDKSWFFILLLTLINWANIAIMMEMLINYMYTDTYLVIYGLINLVLLLYEIVQAFCMGLTNYMDFWNLIDLSRVTICLTWIVLDKNLTEGTFHAVTYVMVVANFLRGLSGFRAFDSTRYYSRLITRAIIETLPFIFIFLYTTLAFGMLYWASGPSYRGDHFNTIWGTPFSLDMGTFNNSTSADLNFLYFMLASVLNVIIIQNLLVSILGNSFDLFQAQSIEVGTMEMTELVIEIENMMFWRRNNNLKMFLQVCDRVQIEGVSDAWEGRVKVIGDMIEKSAKITKKNFDFISAKLDEIEAVVYK